LERKKGELVGKNRKRRKEAWKGLYEKKKKGGILFDTPTRQKKKHGAMRRKSAVLPIARKCQKTRLGEKKWKGTDLRREKDPTPQEKIKSKRPHGRSRIRVREKRSGD